VSAANVARLRTKQGLLDLLVERARDQTSWTRGNVCKAWASLTVEDKVPMGHWLTVTQLAIGTHSRQTGIKWEEAEGVHRVSWNTRSLTHRHRACHGCVIPKENAC